MGVSTAIESMMDFDGYGAVDAIITATWLGAIADSEKFLVNVIIAHEQMLNPTPFIQSTFNTVGAQVALIRALHGYNNTFTHRYTGFESALLDAMIRLDNHEAKAVLVGVFDESTPTVELLLKRMGILKDKPLGEGAIFFVLTSDPLPCSVAEITEIAFSVDQAQSCICVTKVSGKFWSGAMAQTVIDTVEKRQTGEFCIVNDMDSNNPSAIKIQCL